MTRKSTNKNKALSIFVAISSDEKAAAKALAKSKGMTFQGFVGQLIKKALADGASNLEAGL